MNRLYAKEKQYHNQLMRVLWRIEHYLTTKLNIPDIHNLEDEIVELEKIYDNE